MSNGYIYLYLGQERTPDFESFDRVLGSIGLHLMNPATKQISALSITGSQMPVSRAWIEAAIAASMSIRVLWWYSDSESVYCRFHRRPMQPWKIELSLDGVDQDNAEILIAVITRFFKDHCTGGDVAALVVDRTGDLEDTNWDRVVEGGEKLDYFPDILALPRAVASACGVDAGAEAIPECQQYIMFILDRSGGTSLEAKSL